MLIILVNIKIEKFEIKRSKILQMQIYFQYS